MYTKPTLGEELRKRINDPLEQISLWAKEACKERKGLKPEIIDILERLSAISLSPQLQYRKEDLQYLALLLLTNAKSPILQLIEYQKATGYTGVTDPSLYSYKVFVGAALKQQLEDPFDLEKIAAWADKIYLRSQLDDRDAMEGLSEQMVTLSDEMSWIFELLMRMPDSPEFAYTEEELNYLASLLSHDEADIVEKLNAFTQKTRATTLSPKPHHPPKSNPGIKNISSRSFKKQ